MNKPHSQRILSIAPSANGFGFAVMEQELIAYGIKSADRSKNSSKNKHSLEKIQKLLNFYQPDILLLPEVKERHERIKSLRRQIVQLAKKEGIQVKQISRTDVWKKLSLGAKATRHEMAQAVLQRFPELAPLPRKRKAYESEDARMDVFEAVAFIMVFLI